MEPLTAMTQKSKMGDIAMHRLKGQCVFELNTIDLLDISYRCNICGKRKEQTLKSEEEKSIWLDELLSDK